MLTGIDGTAVLGIGIVNVGDTVEPSELGSVTPQSSVAKRSKGYENKLESAASFS
jgi:hypothetical protein